MPLYDNAIDTIRTNLEQLQNGERPKFVAIGYFTDEQFAQINEFRLLAWGFPFDPSIRMRLMLDYYYYRSPHE